MVTAAPKKAAPKKTTKASTKKATAKTDAPAPAKKTSPKKDASGPVSLRSRIECSDTSIKWTEARKRIIQGLLSLDATKASSGVSIEQIAKAGDLPVGVVASRLDSRWDLITEGFVDSAKMEDGTKYFATSKSTKIKF